MTETTNNNNTTSRSRGKHWSFTWNNYNEQDVPTRLPEGAAYIIAGREVAESGTRHLQGAIGYTTKKSFSQVQHQFPNCHLSISRNVVHAVNYCKKEGDYIEFGEVPSKEVRGQRSYIRELQEAVRNGCYSIDQLREDHPEVVAKYPRFVFDYLRQHRPRQPVEEHPLRQWQEILQNDLSQPPTSRTIIFVIDYDGNAGKSWFADWYVANNIQCQIINPGKKADMTFALKEETTTLFIDCPRSKQGDLLQYDFLEDVKNGRVFSTKYESGMKYLMPCHVVVMMNEEPDLTKLSRDRYKLIRTFAVPYI